MIKIAVCDDQKIYVDIISKHVAKYFNDYDMECQISTFTCGKSFVNNMQQNIYDVVFLDIVMPDKDGFEIAEQIMNLENICVVFVTTESNLVFKSLDFRPFHFIPKGDSDVLQLKLKHVVDKLIEHFSTRKPVCFDLPYGEKIYLKPDEILYLSSAANYINVFTLNGNDTKIRKKLDDLSDVLPNRFFVRVHKRYIVNMKHIHKVDLPNSQIILNNKTEIDISRSLKNDFMTKYNEYLCSFS